MYISDTSELKIEVVNEYFIATIFSLNVVFLLNF